MRAHHLHCLNVGILGLSRVLTVSVSSRRGFQVRCEKIRGDGKIDAIFVRSCTGEADIFCEFVERSIPLSEDLEGLGVSSCVQWNLGAAF